LRLSNTFDSATAQRIRVLQQGGKEMKQKVLISGLSLLLTFSLAGCGGQQAQQEPQEPKQEVQQSGAISTEPPAEPLEVKQEVVPTAITLPPFCLVLLIFSAVSELKL